MVQSLHDKAIIDKKFVDFSEACGFLSCGDCWRFLVKYLIDNKACKEQTDQINKNINKNEHGVH